MSPHDDLLAQPLHLACGQTLSNRFVKSALSEGMGDASNNPDERLGRLYRSWSEGGCGLVISGNVMVDRSHVHRPGSLVIDGHEDRAAYTQLAKEARVAGNEFWMQIVHTGRQTETRVNPQPLAPSAIRLKLLRDEHFSVPRAMNEDEILDAINRFAYAARVARDCGYTGVQLHGAHGYLVSQFLSPLSNIREDDWGGTQEKRSRFVVETIRAMRRAVGPDFGVGIKLNSADFQRGGFSAEDSLEVIRLLNAEQVDMLEVSGGTYEQMSMFGEKDGEQPQVKESTRHREAYFLKYAEDIRAVATMPLLVTGGFRTRAGMEEALSSGATDLIGLGRPLCVEPDLPNRMLAGEADATLPYERRLDDELTVVPTHDEQGTPVPVLLTSLVWFNTQLINVGQGKPTEPDLPLLAGVQASMEHDEAQFEVWRGPVPSGEPHADRAIDFTRA